MELPQFHTDRNCELCPLHATASNRCVPTVKYTGWGPAALVVVGQNPGYQEDREWEPFIGRSGRLVKDAYIAPILAENPDLAVYLTNTARCFGPDVPVRAWKTCFPAYTMPDIENIRRAHDQTFLLAVGAPATAATTHFYTGEKLSLKAAIRQQPLQLADDLTGCFTFHPAAVLRNRAAYRGPVSDHIQLISNVIRGRGPAGITPLMTPPRAPLPSDSQRLSLDIESYGAFYGGEQTTFNPYFARLSGEAPPRLVPLACITPYDENYGFEWSMAFDLRMASHRLLLAKWLHHANELCGANLLFDLSWLRADDLAFRHALTYDTRIVDTTIRNHQHHEARPEKGLKDTGRILGIYDHEAQLATGKKFRDPADKDAIDYCAGDTIAAIMLAKELEARIRTDYDVV